MIIRIAIIFILISLSAILIYNKKFRQAFTLSLIPLVLLIVGLFAYLAYYMLSTNYFS
jgi:tryptophan-rich sensory protein